MEVDDREYQMIGFIDDSPATHSLRLHGYPVLGDLGTLLSLIEGAQVDVVVIAAQTLHADRLARVVEACNERKIVLQRLSLSIETLVAPS